MESKAGLGVLKFIVITLGILLLGGLVFMGIMLKQGLLTLMEDKSQAVVEAAPLPCRSAGGEIRIRNRGTAQMVDMEGNIVRLVTRRDSGEFHLIRIDLCTNEVLTDSTLVLEQGKPEEETK